MSPKESNVTQLVCKGHSNKEIAHILNIKEGTVKFHLKNIFKKLNIKSRSQLILLYLPNFTNMENI